MNSQKNETKIIEESLNEQKKRVALLGGSFDPPTLAHMQIACEIYNNFNDIDEVWLVPCGDGRSDKSLRTPAYHRLKMLNLIKEDIIPSDVPLIIDKTELEKGEYVPTYYLLKELTSKYPNKEFIVCVGTDLLCDLKAWKEGEKLINEYQFILILREKYLLSDLPNATFPKQYKVLETIVSGSSTNIRNRIQSQRDKKLHFAINGLTTAKVIQYIEDNYLYLINKK